MAAATALRIAGYCGLAEFPALFAYFFTLCRADTLLLGVVLAYLARGPKHAALLQHKRWFSTALIVLAIAFVVVTAADREFSDSRALFVVGLPVLAALSASALVLAVWHERSWVSIVTRNGLLRWFGIRAYGLYLLHLPILDTCSRYLINRIPFPPELVALPITIGAAAILWRFVERPAIDYGHRFRYASLPTLRPQPEST
jgi:peptidoglycan/LPS O-acetylase OafA/YrhL